MTETGSAIARRGGRPPLDPDQRKKPFCFRVVTERVVHWMVAADLAGMTLSAWMRDALDCAARCELDGDHRFEADVGGREDGAVTKKETADKREKPHSVTVSAVVNSPKADGSVEQRSVKFRRRFEDEESARRWTERVMGRANAPVSKTEDERRTGREKGRRR